MEALNAVGLSPLSVFPKRTEPRKSLSLATVTRSIFSGSGCRFPCYQNKNQAFYISRSLQGSLVILSSFLNSQLAKAITYDEALQQSSFSSSVIDINGILENIVSFTTENPVIVGAGFAVLTVPVVVSQLLSKPKPWGVESAKNAYGKLSGDANAQLVDIRAIGEIKEGGSPDIRGLKKKPVAIVYKSEDKTGFLNKLSLKLKEPENTTLFLLDKFDGNSELVAELVTVNGFKAAYAIKDGAEGSRGWKNSDLPWMRPQKALSLDLSNLTDAFGEVSDVVPLALGVIAAAGIGVLAFVEVEPILQVLGSIALVQFVSTKLLFVEDRKQTVQQIEDLLNTKVAPKELAGDIKQIGKALLPPVITTAKALPSPVAVTSESSVQKSESIPETNNVPPKVEATPEVNSVPKAEVEEESRPVLPQPLSPYPNYPDYKPPSSPIPSQP